MFVEMPVTVIVRFKKEWRQKEKCAENMIPMQKKNKNENKGTWVGRNKFWERKG